MLGQEAVANLGETLAHIVSARRTIIETHSALATVRSQIGCGPMAAGDLDKGPETRAPPASTPSPAAWPPDPLSLVRPRPKPSHER